MKQKPCMLYGLNLSLSCYVGVGVFKLVDLCV